MLSLRRRSSAASRFYPKGVSPTGQEITAQLNQTEVPAATLPCTSCHGQDGRGRPEGGVTPSNITWATLTKPYDAVHPSGRIHPPYTERHLKRAITMGVDPAGNQLHAAMPRYRLSQQDLADLLAYLKRLGHSTEPGVTDAAIRIGVILPPRAGPGEMNRVISGVPGAYGDEINRRGGVYARKIELRFIETLNTPVAAVKAVRAWLDHESVFALLSSFSSGADAALAALAEEREIPLFGAFSVPSPQQSPRFTFYIYSGLNEQARALAIFAARRWSQHDKAVIIQADDEQARAAAATINAQCQKLGWPLLEQITLTDEKQDVSLLARRLREQAVKVVFFLGASTAQNRWLVVAHQFDWQPALLIPSALAGREIFAAPVNLIAASFWLTRRCRMIYRLKLWPNISIWPLLISSRPLRAPRN